MKYDFKCSECSEEHVVEMSTTTFRLSRESGITCPSCGGGKSFHKFNPKDVSVSFKGDAWADKNYKEKNYRANRAAYMSQRQAANNKTPTLVPNYKGEETATWKEAQEAARSDGKVAETYTPLVRKEKK